MVFPIQLYCGILEVGLPIYVSRGFTGGGREEIFTPLSQTLGIKATEVNFVIVPMRFGCFLCVSFLVLFSIVFSWCPFMLIFRNYGSSWHIASILVLLVGAMVEPVRVWTSLLTQ